MNEYLLSRSSAGPVLIVDPVAARGYNCVVRQQQVLNMLYDWIRVSWSCSVRQVLFELLTNNTAQRLQLHLSGCSIFYVILVCVCVCVW